MQMRNEVLMNQVYNKSCVKILLERGTEVMCKLQDSIRIFHE